ncbi:hypothetical protein RO3G_02160 [Rhizopus delemar RA 99-880]|uniref:Uncharacterized protein n=1 Tax=Rhizopus delemar (strain RA 99-880 / ATCC MYA-4621 / FGSC 9543 / NRRL 43880) TaxID=246409 RepID=I1BMM6_RHIO9|nr:hypothetical protein RO3G_02160 [Rhizopus delemar RA 99-880]|eukprot:EIE77456.1 hypothetical protein RO3G_02160 [Rhizopus delemar RA 99-880]
MFDLLSTCINQYPFLGLSFLYPFITKNQTWCSEFDHKNSRMFVIVEGGEGKKYGSCELLICKYPYTYR